MRHVRGREEDGKRENLFEIEAEVSFKEEQLRGEMRWDEMR